MEVEPEHFHGRSEILGLDACWDHGQLRWHDPATGQHLMTFREEIDTRSAAERQADAERDARLAAEARVRELEEELKARDDK